MVEFVFEHFSSCIAGTKLLKTIESWMLVSFHIFFFFSHFISISTGSKIQIKNRQFCFSPCERSRQIPILYRYVWLIHVFICALFLLPKSMSCSVDWIVQRSELNRVSLNRCNDQNHSKLYMGKIVAYCFYREFREMEYIL